MKKGKVSERESRGSSILFIVDFVHPGDPARSNAVAEVNVVDGAAGRAASGINSTPDHDWTDPPPKATPNAADGPASFVPAGHYPGTGHRRCRPPKSAVAADA